MKKFFKAFYKIINILPDKNWNKKLKHAVFKRCVCSCGTITLARRGAIFCSDLIIGNGSSIGEKCVVGAKTIIDDKWKFQVRISRYC